MSTASIAAPGEFKPMLYEGKPSLCATVPLDREYTLEPPRLGKFLHFGDTTLCYISETGLSETVLFVETTQAGQVTDAGTILLNPAL